MAPYVLVATALVILGIAARLQAAGFTRGEPARILLVWLAFSAVTATVAAVGTWMGDASASLHLAAATRICALTAVATLFLFTRSFGIPVGFGAFFWSVPLQLGVAVIIVNFREMFKYSGGGRVLDMGSVAALITIVLTWLYGALALAYAIALYLTLRREGRQKEKRRTLAMIVALAVMLAASGLRGVVSGTAGSALSVAYLGHLAGMLLLTWAFRGPAIPRLARR